MAKEKVILISIDGMRPDGFLNCKNPYIDTMMSQSYYTLNADTISPPVTLPCHMSLFHSVPPARHGITTNRYMPLSRPVEGLFERLKKEGAVSAMYYGWEPLRDISRAGSLTFSEYINAYSEESSDVSLTDRALARMKLSHPDFIFLYMVETDEKGGHDNGWMSGEYLNRISIAIDNVHRVAQACGEEYAIIVTADHGGHERDHGIDIREDRTIPTFYMGRIFPKGIRFAGGSILDIAPTIAKLMGIAPAPEWEGKPVL